LAARANAGQTPRYDHVLLISVDGLHGIDLQNWLVSHPDGALAALSHQGVIYANTYTTAPSNSFPGMIAQVTGATPKSAGVFYDDSYDRTLYAPGSNCQGDPGTETQFAENIDVDKNRVDADGTLGQPLTQIDPKQLPLQLKGSDCTPVFPHNFIRVNTLFEVIRAHSGRTAWADKHPACDILNGPSGQGIQDLFTPEINSLFPGSNGGDNTTSYRATRRNDGLEARCHQRN
jgi:Type I phosphodiesterase / nucleotide pyrophosphatase